MKASQTMHRNRGWRAHRAVPVILALTALLCVTPGCKDEPLRDFRDAASAGLQSGVNSIVDGLVDGLFAALLGDSSDGAAGEGDASTTQ